MFKAIFHARIHVRPVTFEAVFKMAYPDAGETVVGYANELFYHLCRYGPEQVRKLEGIPQAAELIPNGIRQAFKFVAPH